MKRLLIAALLTIYLSVASAADEPRTHALNFCPLAIPVVNLYAMIFEYHVAPRHGFNLRVDYAPMSENDIDITDKAMIINYRWYVDKSIDSLFVGAYTRYRMNSGSGKIAGTRFDYDSTEWTFGVNVGKRWLWKNGFNVVAMVGYGYSDFKETVTNRNPAVDAAMGAFKVGDKDLFFDDPFYGELSIGYAFW